MKINIKYYSYCIITLLFAMGMQGQKKGVILADKKFENYAFVDAIAIYEKIAEKGYADEAMYRNLGDSYFFIANLEKAEKWYTELFKINQVQPAEYYYRYSQTLKAVGNYTLADALLEKFVQTSADDQRAKLFASQRDYLKEIKSNSGGCEISNSAINSRYSDYGSSYLGDKLLFASARDTGGVSKKVFKWNNAAFTNLYIADLSTDGVASDPKLFNQTINDKFHESTPVFTKDGKTMYFTRNNYLNGKKQEDKKNFNLLKIYKATLVNGMWTDVKELPFNSNEYSTAHPTLSLDERTLYFASDMPGTKGLSDLYSVAISGDDNYGVPVNLGFPINTEARETFPFLASDNILYFASDGHPGLGGLDIFSAKGTPEGLFTDIQNLGSPINSPKDDFALLLDKSNQKGFFTSNRDGGQGSDDIYILMKKPVPPCNQALKGVVSDLNSGIVLPNFKLSLFDDKFNLLKETNTMVDGTFSFDVICGKAYYVRAQKEEYKVKEISVVIPKSSGTTTSELKVEKRKKPIAVGNDLAKLLEIDDLYFDLGKAFIRDDAAVQLEKVLAVMNEYPMMKISIRSHTDSRGSAKSNEDLSDRRAKSTQEWLVKKGISADRVTAKGYGESQLVNNCADGVSCTEEEHQANRRSEFIVVSI
jgi:outer membrane protein OmpA-like peptidoglycan-associated protein